MSATPTPDAGRHGVDYRLQAARMRQADHIAFVQFNLKSLGAGPPWPTGYTETWEGIFQDLVVNNWRPANVIATDEARKLALQVFQKHSLDDTIDIIHTFLSNRDAERDARVDDVIAVLRTVRPYVTMHAEPGAGLICNRDAAQIDALIAKLEQGS